MSYEKIYNTYDVIDYLLDLDTYYINISSKYINQKISIKLDKRYKKDSKKQDDKIKNIDSILKYYDEKRKNIKNMIHKINNNEIKNIDIDFM